MASSEYEAGVMPLLLGILPQFFAKASLTARDVMAVPFRKIFEEKKYLEDGSLLTQLRVKHGNKFDFGIHDHTQAEIGQVLASTTNTAPSAFWFIWQVLSDPAVFQDCRREAEGLVQKGPDGVCTIDIAQIKTACPILASTFQEVLRYHGISISARVVMEDVLIDGQYLFKKGGMVMTPLAVIHSDEALWGPTAGQFDHKRFLKSNKDGSRSRAPAAAFRGFGAGHVLCPGRHLATNSILAFTVLLLARFDIRPVAGKWVEPKKDSIMNSSFPTPMNKVEIELVPRDSNEWRVLYSDNDKIVKMAAEDLE
jgi:cytochrome P450